MGTTETRIGGCPGGSLATDEGRRGVILTVVAAAATAYTDLLDLDKQLDIAQQTAISREQTLKLFRLRYDRGLISELELSQAESECRSAEATLPLLRKLIGQQENALSILLGRNPGPIVRGKPLDHLVLPAVPAGLPSQLLERRPDIRQAEQNLIAANARIGVAKAQYFPTISLTGLFGVQSTDLSTLFAGPARTWTYALPIAAPVFTAGLIAGSVKAAEAVQKETLLRYRQVIQQAFREVEDGLIDQAKTREQLQTQREQVVALQAYARLARLRYENGYTSYIEVLDAERSLFDAELSYIQTQAVLFRALVNLYKAMGGAGSTRPPPSPLSRSSVFSFFFLSVLSGRPPSCSKSRSAARSSPCVLRRTFRRLRPARLRSHRHLIDFEHEGGHPIRHRAQP